jgi:hypothetical protein
MPQARRMMTAFPRIAMTDGRDGLAKFRAVAGLRWPRTTFRRLFSGRQGTSDEGIP